ncbi:hypothetical protein UPYG_G00233220 [Umbra pygmaea]|uniref:Nidogen-2 n=1 Tax=Umbra pygmaea TaxID=75934 RepID=A0ABD0X007_UMBPY
MARGMLTIFLIQLSCTVHLVTAIQRKDIFPYGTSNGDFTLQEGDDETSKVLALKRPLYFYEAQFHELYVATNGIISAQDLPMEKQYVDDGFPTDFPVIAPFLADLDTSKEKGGIYYRVTESPALLNRVAQEVQRGFPNSRFMPTHAVIATWENVGAYEEVTRAAGSADRLNTFQAVVAYDENDSYAIFLYPEDGLNFFGTRPKESYNVEIELPARVGFSRGEVTYIIFARMEGPYYSITSNEQSVKNLYQLGNTGIPGVWLFHIGSSYSFQNVVPAAIVGTLATPPLRGPEGDDSTTADYTATFEEDGDDYSPIPEPSIQYTAIPVFHAPSHSDQKALPSQDQMQPHGGDLPLSSDPQYHVLDSIDMPPPVSGPSGLEYPARGPDPRNQPQLEDGHPQAEAPQVVPRPENTAHEVFPNNQEESSPRLESSPPLAPGSHVFSVVEEDDVNFNTGVIQYSTETKPTCARHQQQCSQNAYCTDYTSGFCCHCRSGFYGNGRHCLPDGVPHRVNGKVSGNVDVGSTPVNLNSVDLHAYIVVSDGRAYTAISEVPEPIGWALMPVSPIGEIFGWLFAQELPNSQAGFKITGAEFTRNAEVTFYPGNQRLSIVQMARGLDNQNYLSVDTHLHGSVPFITPGASVQVEPYKEIYQYYPSVVTSASVREFTVVSVERGSETFTYQIRQNITYRDCSHGPPAGAEMLELNTERIFVMYGQDKNILRYAITNKISPVGVEPLEPVLVNPCYAGTHDCDTTAQCLPGEGEQYQCQCATGYRGDGRNCYDVDECAEGLSHCGPHAHCLNLPGSHSCQCLDGYEFGFDGRTCTDIDECASQPCHPQATCANTLGSFQCQCHPAFHGNGLQCVPREDQPEHPKTQCEQHRDSLQGGFSPRGPRPAPGAFVPQCDEQGQYRALQCHGSTGQCWCVDSRGQERAGTRTPPSTPPTNCDQPDHPERPKTHCEQHRDSVQTTSPEGYPIVGAFVPQCDDQGQYRDLQCHGSTGHCWCVDSRGQERAGTRRGPGTGQPNCDEPECTKKAVNLVFLLDGSASMTRGEFELIKGFISDIMAKLQNSTIKFAAFQFSTKTRAVFNFKDFQEGRALAKLWKEEQMQDLTNTHYAIHFVLETMFGNQALSVTADSTTVLVIITDGNPSDTDHKYSIKSGKWKDVIRILATIRYDNVEGIKDIASEPKEENFFWTKDHEGLTDIQPNILRRIFSIQDCYERPKTSCEYHRDSVQTTSPAGYPIEGAFVPQCDDHGQYRDLQCHGSTGHCWCVDSRGQERAGTRRGPGTGQPNCDEPDHPERPKTHCELHRDSVQTTSPEGYPIVGAFVPQCDDQGQYRDLQCHSFTGHCWCVDSRGQERAGTRRGPGTGRPNCDEPDQPERPRTHCEQHRDSVQTTSPEGYPIVGAFVPQCDDQGQYRDLQCHSSTGHCWCVDSRGQERAGTRRGPGTGRPNCDEPDQPERPRTHCEQHRDSVQTTSPEGYPIVGAFVPQCDDQGQYRDLQCHSSTGHCWCVDSRGQERAGTRRGPGTGRPNCDEPVHPERPKTHCEQRRDSVQITSPEGYPIVGAFVPQCDDQGQYRDLQCHSSTGHCWCVDSRGQERAGTRRGPGTGQPNCDEPVAPTQRPETVCERWRASLVEHYEGKPKPHHYLPQCDTEGQFNPVQCYGDSSYCWCVDRDGREVAGTRSHDAVKPACIPTVAPPTIHPLPRPDVTPPPSGTFLLYAQGQQIGALPLNGTRMDSERSSTLLALHGSIVVGIDYDCKERKVYWTDLAGRTISRAKMEPGAEPETLINTGLTSPEGLAVDVKRRVMFWVDSTPDKIERANLDGSGRQTLFDTDLVNPRAIIVDSSRGTLYWTDWNREAPKIESSSVDGHSRKVLVKDGIGLPNALSFDTVTRQVCWADAGTKRLECIASDGTGRRVIHSNLNYPFSMVFYSNHFYFTDWRRDGVIALSRDSSQFTDEYLPDQRSHLYGVTIATTHCL